MKFIKFLLIGVMFGIIMSKSEAISWYRIQEMFRFQSFHMYGIIGSALFSGILMNQIIKRKGVKNSLGQPIYFSDKKMSIPRYLLGGIIFGLGWALTGACPGPLFTLVGYGYTVYVIVIISALLGTFVYGLLRDKLPH